VKNLKCSMSLVLLVSNYFTVDLQEADSLDSSLCLTERAEHFQIPIRQGVFDALLKKIESYGAMLFHYQEDVSPHLKTVDRRTGSSWLNDFAKSSRKTSSESRNRCPSCDLDRCGQHKTSKLDPFNI
jgi:hypothetical protein